MQVSTLALALAFATALASCSRDAPRGSRDVPRALRDRAEREEVAPYAGFSVPGLSLYRLSGAVPDHGWSYVVGVDDEGALVEGPALMRRLGALEPEVFAARAIAILLREEGTAPVLPSDPRPQLATEDEWSVVEAPRREGNAIVFFLMVGEMHPELTEISVDASSFEVTRRSATEVLLARGRTVVTGAPMCHPYAECGCFVGCRRFEPVRVPGSDALHRRLVDEPGGGRLFVAAPECAGEGCLRVCRADSPTAFCDPALVPVDPEECAERCAPGEAGFHCETLEDGCRRVDHPIRAGAR